VHPCHLIRRQSSQIFRVSQNSSSLTPCLGCFKLSRSTSTMCDTDTRSTRACTSVADRSRFSLPERRHTVQYCSGESNQLSTGAPGRQPHWDRREDRRYRWLNEPSDKPISHNCSHLTRPEHAARRFERRLMCLSKPGIARSPHSPSRPAAAAAGCSYLAYQAGHWAVGRHTALFTLHADAEAKKSRLLRHLLVELTNNFD